MARIDPAEYRKRLDAITEIFTGIVSHAGQVSRTRCPYKNRASQCTAAFGCRNKRRAPEAGALPVCAGDDKLDFRSAWEV